MSRKILMSSDFTKLMATPLRPNRPERPILKEERSCMCIQLWVKVWWKVNLTLWLLRVTSISFLPYHTTHESQTKVKRRGRNPQLKKLWLSEKCKENRMESSNTDFLMQRFVKNSIAYLWMYNSRLFGRS